MTKKPSALVWWQPRVGDKVHYTKSLNWGSLFDHYHAVVVALGAETDRPWQRRVKIRYSQMGDFSRVKTMEPWVIAKSLAAPMPKGTLVELRCEGWGMLPGARGVVLQGPTNENFGTSFNIRVRINGKTIQASATDLARLVRPKA